MINRNAIIAAGLAGVIGLGIGAAVQPEPEVVVETVTLPAQVVEVPGPTIEVPGPITTIEVVPESCRKDRTFEEYPEESIADWHKARGLWVD
jgi:hypothetical protein